MEKEEKKKLLLRFVKWVNEMELDRVSETSVRIFLEEFDSE